MIAKIPKEKEALFELVVMRAALFPNGSFTISRKGKEEEAAKVRR